MNNANQAPQIPPAGPSVSHSEQLRLLATELTIDREVKVKNLPTLLRNAADEIDRLRAAMLEGARILEADGDEWGVAHKLRGALTPNASLQPSARSADRLEGDVGQED